MIHTIQKYVLTTNLSPQLYEWLDKEAKARKATKRVILEYALEKVRIEEKKRRMAQSFRRANKDPEIMTMAEWGMQDYAKQLDKLEDGHDR